MVEKIAFVFSGGSSFGSMEVGMLKALTEYGITADFVVGTSVGALNATYYAYHPNLEGVQKLEKIWHSIKSKDIFPVSPFKSILRIIKKENYLINSNGLEKLLIDVLPCNNLEDTKIPVHVVTTDVLTGEEVVFSSGNAVQRLLASAAIPVTYPSVEIGKHLLIDGGVLNNTPISTAVRFGATKVIVLPTGYTCDRREEPSSLIEMILTSYSYMQHQKLATDIEFYKEKTKLKVIPPLCPISVSPKDFSKSKELIERAYESTQKWLKTGNLESDEVPQLMKFHSHNDEMEHM
ncbi:patatin-like phospholipase family protein [Promethearchaeum syntrophicum]|uniref:Patatin-like phospholipase family protein n=1 Tax=Promethearchaeum syntrophicum TaxID=2594042 RepID=A0A5B9D849_9ARCH|nr:patatin-like phospholipase family protein [Candidatus Prometheoarchaeum syntrophicum]QEE15233.1 hypothetical protein DSAG12_01057 [Candidatus Prometheoarchaeum syntrophicum]